MTSIEMAVFMPPDNEVQPTAQDDDAQPPAYNADESPPSIDQPQRRARLRPATGKQLPKPSPWRQWSFTMLAVIFSLPAGYYFRSLLDESSTKEYKWEKAFDTGSGVEMGLDIVVYQDLEATEGIQGSPRYTSRKVVIFELVRKC